MRTFLIFGFGLLYVALFAAFSDTARWVETIAQSSVPYAAIPFAVGVAAGPRARILTAAVKAAGVSIMTVAVFYTVNQVKSDYDISLWGPVTWTLAAAVSGFVLGAVGNGTARLRRSTWVSVVFCVVLALGQVYVVVSGGGYPASDIAALTGDWVVWSCVVLAAHTATPSDPSAGPTAAATGGTAR